MTALSVLFVGFVVLVVSVYLKLFPSIEEKLRWGVLSLFLLIVYDLVISIGWAVMSLVSASKNDVSKSLSEPVGEKREQQVGDVEDTVDNASKPVGISASPSRGGRGDAASGSSSSSSPSQLDRIALKTALVVDVGEVNGRYGFAGDEVPLVRDCQALLAGLGGNGKKAPTATQVAASGGLRQHIKDGAISDWESLEKVWFSQYDGGSNAGSSSHTSLRTGASDAIDPSEHPVLLSWSPSFSSKDAEQAAEIFFETRRVPALSLGISPVLALYASGRTTGCSVHSGESFTHAMAVSEGFALAGTHMRTHYAGKLVTDNFAAMLQTLQRQQQSLLPPAQQDKFNPALSDYSAFLRLEKSRYCVCSSVKIPYAALSQAQAQAQAQVQALDEPIFSALGQSDAAAPFNASSTAAAAAATATAASDTHMTQLKLPDGNIVNLPGVDQRLPREPAHMQYTCAESLFRSADHSIQKIVERSIAAAGGALTGMAGKADLYGTAAGTSSGDGGAGSLLGVRQDELWSNIVISGGNANLPGFSQRLQHELGELLSLGGVGGLDGGEALKYAAGVPVYETEAADRGDALWLGGSVLASFESFSGNWVKRAEYLENGAGAFIHTRCQTKL